jgi:hypothetical protein
VSQIARILLLLCLDYGFISPGIRKKEEFGKLDKGKMSTRPQFSFGKNGGGLRVEQRETLNQCEDLSSYFVFRKKGAHH